MSSDIIVKIENLSKCYEIYENPRDRLKQFILPRLQNNKKKYYKEFWAVKNVSFEIKKGETLGIIGFNGAGKSTLLQMICGTLNQTDGKIYTNAKISALLELGAGFNPEFTGRENVFMNCALHGMSHQNTLDRFDEIAEFAGIGEFIDQPVKFYSSGMFARLAFSAAVHVDPDLLIVDEALSVGDMAFQEKSINKMKEIRQSGTSILFVTHSISAVRNFCDTAMWLDKGTVKAFGERLIICEQYQNEVEGKSNSNKSNILDLNSTISDNEQKSLFINNVKCDKNSYPMAADIHIEIELSFNKNISSYGIGVIIYDEKHNIISIINTLRDSIIITKIKEKWQLSIKDNHFAPGKYTATVSISDNNAMFSYDKAEHCIQFRIEMERNSNGLAKVEGIVRCEHEWH